MVLYSGRPVCISCSGVVDQFLGKFPGIRVNIIEARRKWLKTLSQFSIAQLQLECLIKVSLSDVMPKRPRRLEIDSWGISLLLMKNF